VFWIDVGLLKSADVEIKNMNEGKVGAPFQYSDIHTPTTRTFADLLSIINISTDFITC
jgi:hypothetical protein